jgi:hypothetical protein
MLNSVKWLALVGLSTAGIGAIVSPATYAQVPAAQVSVDDSQVHYHTVKIDGVDRPGRMPCASPSPDESFLALTRNPLGRAGARTSSAAIPSQQSHGRTLAWPLFRWLGSSSTPSATWWIDPHPARLESSKSDIR